MTRPATNAVFLSYASQDADAARRIRDALQAAGIEVWFDQSALKGGAAWDAEIRRQIHDCALFVPIVSAHTEQRLEGYFRLEWRLAEQRTHLMALGKPFLVPVVIDSTPDHEARVPDAFREVQWTRLPAGEGAAALAEHLNALLRPAEAKAGDAAAPAAGPGHSHGPGSPRRNVATSGRRAVLWSLIAAATVIVGMAAGVRWYFRLGDGATARLPAGSRAATPIPDKSIAVLPFENLSSSADDGYLADGIANTLLQLISQQRELKVIARTSSFTFRSSKEDARAIGQRLGVATLLEGSVQHAGERLRVIVQLVSTRDGTNLWSQTYDRMMADVFTVQDDIAAKVAGALRVSLAGQSRGVGDGTPKYTPPIVAVGLSLVLRGRVQAGHSELLPESLALVQRAVRLDPGSGDVWVGLGLVRGVISDVQGQEDALRRAIELNPGLASAYQNLAGMLYLSGGDASEARTLIEKAAVLDPLRADLQRERVLIAIGEGRGDEAVQAGLRWIALNEGGVQGYNFTGQAYMLKGQIDQAIRYLRRASAGTGGPDSPTGWALVTLLRALGDAEGAASLESRLADAPNPGLSRNLGQALVFQAEAQLLKNDAAAAERSLRRAPASLASAANELARLEIGSNQARAAIDRLKAVAPGLGGPVPTIERNTVGLVPTMARAYEAIGEADRSQRLLAAADAYLRPRPIAISIALGPSWVKTPLLHARVLALQGRRGEALAALRAGVDAGIGFEWQLWSIDDDFAAIRSAPEFRQCIEIAKARNARQLESLRKQPELPPSDGERT